MPDMPVAAGSFVSLPPSRYGRVNLVVKSGVVPGVDQPLNATPESPAARVALWRQEGNRGAPAWTPGWAPTGESIAARVAALTPIEPLTDLSPEAATSGTAARLVALHSGHLERVHSTGAPLFCAPGAEAVKEVFRRGVLASPYDWRAPEAQDWALHRVETFLALAGGQLVGGYRRDADLLPAAHPLREPP